MQVIDAKRKQRYQTADSDSVSLGSNPGSPAKNFPFKFKACAQGRPNLASGILGEQSAPNEHRAAHKSAQTVRSVFFGFGGGMDAKIERWLSREKEGVFYLYEMEMPSGRLARRSLKTRDEIEAKRRFDNPEPYLGPSKTEVVKALRQIVREDQKTGYVYFIKSGDFLKVGYSAAPRERLSSIRTSSPLDCELIGYVPGSAKAERRIHFLLGHAHHRNEWFCATPAILAAIDAVRWRGRVNAK